MRIPLPVRTLLSLYPVITPTASAAPLQPPLQTGDTFVADGNSFVPVKRGMALPAPMVTAAAPARVQQCTGLNDFRTECIPVQPTVTRSPYVPTGPPKKTNGLTTEIATSVIIIRPTTTHTRTITSTDTSFETATTTITRSTPAYIAAMRPRDTSSTLKRSSIPRDDMRVHPRSDPVSPRDNSDQDLSHLSGDQLHESLIEATDRAIGSLRHLSTEAGPWQMFFHGGAKNRPEKSAKQQLGTPSPPLDNNYWPGFTRNETGSVAWQTFKEMKLWEIDADRRPYVLLQHVELSPPIEPKSEWVKDVQIYINLHIPFEQSGPLPTQMEEHMFLELDRGFDSILQEVKHDMQVSFRLGNGDQAADNDILEELRYLLLYKHLAVPILVEATPDEVDALKMEFLNDVAFTEAVGGEQLIQALFTAHDSVEVLKGSIRTAKIDRATIRDLAEALVSVIYKGIIPGNVRDHFQSDASNHKLVARARSMELTPEKQRIETKLRFDKDLLEGFDSDEVELIEFIAHGWFQDQMDDAIKEAEDMVQLERRLEWIVHHGRMHGMNIPHKEGEPEYRSSPRQDWIKKRTSRDGNTHSPSTFKVAIQAINDAVVNGMGYMWEVVDAIMNRTSQRHPLEDVEDHGKVLVARSRPFVSPKQARKFCMRKCSAKKEPCAC